MSKANELVNGGLTVVRPSIVKLPDVAGVMLMTDLHLGASNCDVELIKSDLEEARLFNCRIIIAGDIWDFIQPGDKRYTADCIHPRLWGRKDSVNEAVKWAMELLSPYADRIDMLSLGNHDTVIEKAGFDPVMELTDRLTNSISKESQGHVIHHGGYTGYIYYKLLSKYPRPGRTFDWTIFYTHGAGSGGRHNSVMQGLVDKRWASADLYWSGHHHTRGVENIVTLGDGGHDRDARPISGWYVKTGAYLSPYRAQSAASIKRYGRRTTYAADAAMRPNGLGGVMVTLEGGSHLRVGVRLHDTDRPTTKANRKR